MPYCALPDATALLPKFTIDATSKPTAEQAGQFLTDAQILIDTQLGAIGFATPVTGTASLAYLKIVNAYGAAWKILQAMFQAGETAAQATRDEMKAAFDQLMQLIFQKPIMLIDAPRLVPFIAGPRISSLQSWQQNTGSIVPTTEDIIDNSPTFRVKAEI